MALQLASQIPADTYGIAVTFPTAYCRITEVFINDESVVMKVARFADADARDEAKKPFREDFYRIDNYDHDDPRPLKAALYAYLKSLPDFVGAVDV